MKSHQAFRVSCTDMKSLKNTVGLCHFVYWWTVELKPKNVNELESSLLTWHSFSASHLLNNKVRCWKLIRMQFMDTVVQQVSTVTEHIDFKVDVVHRLRNHKRWVSCNTSGNGFKHSWPWFTNWIYLLLRCIQGRNKLIFSGGKKNDCNFLYVITKHAFENFGGGGSSPVAPWLRAWLHNSPI